MPQQVLPSRDIKVDWRWREELVRQQRQRRNMPTLRFQLFFLSHCLLVAAVVHNVTCNAFSTFKKVKKSMHENKRTLKMALNKDAIWPPYYSTSFTLPCSWTHSVTATLESTYNTTWMATLSICADWTLMSKVMELLACDLLYGDDRL